MNPFALLRRLPPDPRADAVLLAAFADAGDSAAFAELVRRHGPVVWAACRRNLPDHTDAEDAFQASFLVLARRAGRLRDAGTVGPWLYRVAALTGRNLRRKNARRLARFRPLPADVPAKPPADSPDLDAVLLGLPEKYRGPLVLCHLQGLSRREAAVRLGCPEGTLSTRLARGLAKLRANGGIVPAVAVGVPAGLAAATSRAAAVFRIANISAAGGVPAAVSLAEGALRMIWLKKLATAGVLAVAVLTTGFGIISGRPETAAAGDDKKKETAPPPKAAPERTIDPAILAKILRVQDKELQQMVTDMILEATAELFFVGVSAVKDTPFTVTEWDAGRPFAVTAFRPIEPTGDKDGSPADIGYAAAMEKYLTRAVAAKSDRAKIFFLKVDSNVSHFRLRLALVALEKAGVKSLKFTGYVFEGGLMLDPAAYPADYAGRIPGYVRHENRRVELKELMKEVEDGQKRF